MTLDEILTKCEYELTEVPPGTHGCFGAPCPECEFYRAVKGLVAEVARLQQALTEALDGWQVQVEQLECAVREQHPGCATWTDKVAREDIARLRALASPAPGTETP